MFSFRILLNFGSQRAEIGLLSQSSEELFFIPRYSSIEQLNEDLERLRPQVCSFVGELVVAVHSRGSEEKIQLRVFVALDLFRLVDLMEVLRFQGLRWIRQLLFSLDLEN